MIASAGDRISDQQKQYKKFIGSYLSGMRFKDDAAKTAVDDKVKTALRTKVKNGHQKISINKTVACADGTEGELTAVTYTASSGKISGLKAVWKSECPSSKRFFFVSF